MLPSCRLIRSLSNLVRRKKINLYRVAGSSWGSFPKKKKTIKLNQNGYDGCPESFRNSSVSFLEASWTKTKIKFIKVRFVECGERICATAALEHLWEEFKNFPEAFRKQTRPEKLRWPKQRPGASGFTGIQHAWTTCSGTSGWTSNCSSSGSTPREI